MNYATTARNAAIAAVAALFNAGSGGSSASCKIYQGTIPASPQAAPTGSTLLVTIPLANPAFGAPSTGTVSIPGSVSATVATSGTAQWARFVDLSGNAVVDMTVGISSADINFDVVAFIAGGTAALSALSITQPQ
jgi:phospholipase/lecithinase/hemolysin